MLPAKLAIGDCGGDKILQTVGRVDEVSQVRVAFEVSPLHSGGDHDFFNTLQ
jgi:hypothetical protein